MIKNDELVNKMFDNLPEYISMKTKVWGPTKWFFLHSMTLAYPKEIVENNKYHQEVKNSMYHFLKHLGNVLPCPICGDSYNKYIQEEELQIENHLDSRRDLFTFIYKIHEKVNDKLGVPLCDRPSLEEALRYYTKFVATGEIPCTTTTDEDRAKKRLKGCTEGLVNYHSIVNVLENGNLENSHLIKENFGNSKKELFRKESFNKEYIIRDVIYIAIIIALAMFIYWKFYLK